MAGPAIRFGSHLFDPNTGSLRRGRVCCKLQSQPAQLLALLLERAGDVVTRDDIRQALWPDTVVAFDQNINFAVRQIRVALDVDAGLVQTVPRRGYRLVGEVTRVDPGRRDHRWKRVAVAAAVLLAAASGFGAGVVVRNRPAGQFVYDHLVHPDRCPYLRMFFPNHRNS
jgi:DNA-binding winged helix-turn-helix (wHTH) protein